jgi:hypothetical protein
MRLRLLASLLPLGLVACSSAPTGDASDTTAARLSAADVASLNIADHACGVVLRDAHLNLGRGGYESSCDPNGQCWIVWAGDVDVSNGLAVQGLSVGVRYQGGADPTWYEATVAQSGDPAPAGFTRRSFRMTSHTAPYPGPFNDIQLIAYVRSGIGTTYWDHNRNPGAFSNDALNAANSYAIVDDGSCGAPYSAPSTSVAFGAGWTTVQNYPVRAGTWMTVDYALARLPQCMGSTEDGVPTWGTSAFARFSPGGEIAESPFQLGGPSTPPADYVFQFGVPAEATGVELWFVTQGQACPTSYDSDYGRNYRFAVTR